MFDLFGNLIEEKKPITREELEKALNNVLMNISLEEVVSIITNEFNEVIEYFELTKGKSTCQKTSLLFNPHRLDTKTSSSKLRIYNAMKTENFISGLARAVLFKKGKVNELFYQALQLGINGIQYVNEFPPHIARDILKKYNVKKNSKVLDPCGGWGGRLIGTSVVSDFYECFEPSTRTFNGLNKLLVFIKKMNNEFEAKINCIPFEDAEIKKEHYDFAFTSPPYYNTEEYSNEESNSLNRYSKFESWCNGFYLPMIEKTIASLKHDCFFVLNIGSRKYPLNEVLLHNFGSYEITKDSKRLGGVAGMNKEASEGEVFYAIRKN